MINAAIIGVSGFGQVHYRDLMRYHNEGRLKIAAAAIINQEQEAEKCALLRELGCVIYDDYRKMLADFKGRLDLCCIPTGIGLHRPMAVAAMESGASAFIEKPAAPTVQDVDAIRQAERATGRFTAVGYQSIYQPMTRRVKEELVAGKIGKVQCIKGVGLWPRDHRYYTRNNWAGKLRDNSGWVLDSPFNNALAHYLNLPLFFGGETFETSARLESIQAQLYRVNSEIETTDTAMIHAVSPTGIDIYFYCTHNSQEHFGPVIEIRGDKGSIIWKPNGVTFNYENGQETLAPLADPHDRNAVMDALLARLENPQAFTCSLDIAGTHVLAVNGAHESSPIVPVPADNVERLTMEDGNYRYICRGIDELLHRLYEEERLPNASDFPWIKNGEKIPMANYSRFDGGKLR
jgi:predicted dehydrogenase